MPRTAVSPAVAEVSVELELLLRDVEEPAEVDVVSPGCSRSTHDVEIQPVVRAVDDDGHAVEGARKRRGVAGVHVLVSPEPEVAPHNVCPPLLEGRGDV